MTKSEIINSLKDQARDKDVLANGEAYERLLIDFRDELKMQPEEENG